MVSLAQARAKVIRAGCAHRADTPTPAEGLRSAVCHSYWHKKLHEPVQFTSIDTVYENVRGRFVYESALNQSLSALERM